VDAADEIDASIALPGQGDRNLAVAKSEVFGLFRHASCPG
jgi:hypothetical protein